MIAEKCPSSYTEEEASLDLVSGNTRFCFMAILQENTCQVSKAVRKAKKTFEQKLARNSKSDHRAMFSYINRRASYRVKVESGF